MQGGISYSHFGVCADTADEPAQCCVVEIKLWPEPLLVCWSALYQILAPGSSIQLKGKRKLWGAWGAECDLVNVRRPDALNQQRGQQPQSKSKQAKAGQSWFSEWYEQAGARLSRTLQRGTSFCRREL